MQARAESRRPPGGRLRRGLGAALAVLAALAAGCAGSSSSGGTAATCTGFTSPGMGAGAFTLSGSVSYEDRPFNASGFTGGSALLPAREVQVQVVRCSDGGILAQGPTDLAGAFSVSGTNTGPAGVYVRALTRIQETFYQVTVKDQSAGATYGLRSSAFDEAAPPALALTALASVGIGAPFNILDQALTSLRYVDAAVPFGTALDPLTLVWEANTTTYTAYFPDTTTIEILDQPGAPSPDTDGYDDMVITHEVGHYVADQISKDDSPGGFHAAGETDQDARLAWSEGWGNFFSGAAQNSPDYVDTYNPSTGSVLWFSLEDLDPGVQGSTAELAVTATLWDTIDGPGGPADTDADPATLTAVQVLQAVEDLTADPDPVEFMGFWNALRLANYLANPADLANFQTAAWNNGIDLYEDDGTDDTVGGATALAGPPATVDANLAWDATAGPTPDLDQYQVTLTGGTAYTIQTTMLSDGADTYLEVLDAAGTTVLKSNDNWNNIVYSDPCGGQGEPACPVNGPSPALEPLSSLILYTPPADGIYTIRVRRSVAAPPSAGLFGGYRLRVHT